jgi:hypothetical protein
MDYEAQEADAIEARRAAWHKRTAPSASKEATRARQRRHRLLVALTPTERPPPDCDPYELAKQAIDNLNQLKPGLAHSEVLTLKLELVTERIKQLATGPRD